MGELCLEQPYWDKAGGQKGSQEKDWRLEKTGRDSKGIETAAGAMIGVDVPSKQREKTTAK